MNISKYKNFSEWFNTVISEAELADLRYNVKGFVVFRPWSVKSIKLMYAAYEEELEKRGHIPVIFPSLIPESNFKIEEKHVEGFTPQVFWIEQAGGNKLEEKLALRPTSETAMYRMYSLWIQGTSDLPLKIYQSCQVWRYETKATKPFFRSREFYWIEAHDCFATEKEAIEQVKEDMQITEEIVHNKFGIPFIFFQRPEWDKFPGAVHTYAADTLMPDGRVLQLPSTHFLGQNFAKAFGVYYQDQNGNRTPVWQTCYGPCISRIYGAMFCVHGDEKGLLLPFDFAPLQVVIVPIFGKGKDEQAIIKYSQEVLNVLERAKIRARLDLSPSTPGFKYNHWELLGVPIRVEIGEKELAGKTITVALRDSAAKISIPFDGFADAIIKEGKSLSSRLRAKADEYFNSHILDAKTMDELKSGLEKGCIVRVPYCSMEQDGKACADEIKSKLAGDVRGVRYPFEPIGEGERCIQCGRKALHWAYIARQY